VVNTEFYSLDICLFLLTLVLGTHVGKLYSASTLILFEVLLAGGIEALGRPLNSN